MRADGLTIGAIARRLFTSESAVRRALSPERREYERERRHELHRNPPPRCDRCGGLADEYGTCIKFGIHITRS